VAYPQPQFGVVGHAHDYTHHAAFGRLNDRVAYLAQFRPRVHREQRHPAQVLSHIQRPYLDYSSCFSHCSSLRSKIEDRGWKIAFPFDPQSSILDPRSSIFYTQSSIFYPRSSIFDVFTAASDLIPGKIHEHFRLGPTDPFDRLRRNKGLSSRKPAAGLDYDGADGPVSVVDDEIVHVADFAVGGLDVIPPHLVDAAQMLVV